MFFWRQAGGGNGKTSLSIYIFLNENFNIIINNNGGDLVVAVEQERKKQVVLYY